jgi:aspartate racemase
MSKKHKPPFKTIGILGGMGPDASANLYKKIIQLAQDTYHAVQDTDYPPMMLYSLPLVGFDETGIAQAKAVKQQLVAGVKRLEKAGSDFIIVACNTVSYFHKDMQTAVRIPVLNIVEEVAHQIKHKQYQCVGLLTSESTNRLQLYQQALQKIGVNSLSVNEKDQQKLNHVILHVMAGTQGKKDIVVLKKIITRLRQKGAQAIVLGCTEIPLAITQKDVTIKLFDAVDIISHAALQCAFHLRQTGSKHPAGKS